MEWTTSAPTAVAMIEVSSITKNMEVVIRQRRARRGCPVIHCASVLAAASSSCDEWLGLGCDSSSTEGCGEGCFCLFLVFPVPASMGRGIVDWSVESIVEDSDRVGASMVAAPSCGLEMEGRLTNRCEGEGWEFSSRARNCLPEGFDSLQGLAMPVPVSCWQQCGRSRCWVLPGASKPSEKRQKPGQ